MKTIVIGLGIQGCKRQKVCGCDLVSTVDPVISSATYKNLIDVPLDSYEAACVCVPSDIAFDCVHYLIRNKKHVLVEKPLWCHDQKQLKDLQYLATKNKSVLYIAYNHRFEPSLIEAKNLLIDRKIGEVYFCRMFYGNGTAKLVKDSPWRDKGIGIFGEIGPHLLDFINFLFCRYDWYENIELIESNNYENETPDHIIFKTSFKSIHIECEATYLSWRNTFTLDIIGEKGSIHLRDFCKWGVSSLVWRDRVLPSGVPKAKELSWRQDDPTWKKEWIHFKWLCDNGFYISTQQINDLHINHAINKLVEQSEKHKQWRECRV